MKVKQSFKRTIKIEYLILNAKNMLALQQLHSTKLEATTNSEIIINFVDGNVTPHTVTVYSNN